MHPNTYKLLGIENILLAVLFVFILSQSAYAGASLTSISSIVLTYSPNFIILLLTGINIFLAKQFLTKPQKKFPFVQYVILTQFTLFWFLLLFVGWFVSANMFFPLLSIIVSAIPFIFIKKTPLKFLISISVMTLLVTSTSFISGFEENYCWNRGSMADPTGSKMVIATEEDVKTIKTMQPEIKTGDKVGEAFLVHFKCHESFDMIRALEDIYISPFFSTSASK